MHTFLFPGQGFVSFSEHRFIYREGEIYRNNSGEVSKDEKRNPERVKSLQEIANSILYNMDLAHTKATRGLTEANKSLETWRKILKDYGHQEEVQRDAPLKIAHFQKWVLKYEGRLKTVAEVQQGVAQELQDNGRLEFSRNLYVKINGIYDWLDR